MEDVLDVYHLPYDRKRPVICLDEPPFQLLGEKVQPLAIKDGKEKKFDSEHIRHGVASVFLAFEPVERKTSGESLSAKNEGGLLPFSAGSGAGMDGGGSHRPRAG